MKESILKIAEHLLGKKVVAISRPEERQVALLLNDNTVIIFTEGEKHTVFYGSDWEYNSNVLKRTHGRCAPATIEFTSDGVDLDYDPYGQYNCYGENSEA